MKAIFKKPVFLLIALGLLGGLLLSPLAVLAATPNPAPGADTFVIPLHISGQRTASTTAVAKLTLPFAAKLLSATATARASGGTSPTLTVDIKEAGTSVLSAPVAITAGTVAQATVTDAALADESAITVDLAVTGTNPTWDDITVLLTLSRR